MSLCFDVPHSMTGWVSALTSCSSRMVAPGKTLLKTGSSMRETVKEQVDRECVYFKGGGFRLGDSGLPARLGSCTAFMVSVYPLPNLTEKRTITCIDMDYLRAKNNMCTHRSRPYNTSTAMVPLLRVRS